MASYWHPKTVTEEPLLLGGFASLRQGAYAIGGIVLAAGLGVSLHPPWLIVALLLMAAGVIAYGLGWRKHPRTGEYLDRTLVRSLRYSRQCHIYLYRRGGGVREA